jgi:Ca-activated chloride channel homolog
VKAAVTRLGLTYSLMTPFTSFVAVDQVKRADGRVETVKQPLPLPEGVSDLAVGGASPGSQGFSHRLLKMMPSASMGMLAARAEGARPALETSPVPPINQLPDSGGKLSIQVLKATGGLEAEAVKATLTSGLAGWREHYEKKRQEGVKLPGELNFSFSLDATGRMIGDPAIEGSLKDQELRKSLLETLKGLLFAAPKEGSAAVTVKIVLE